MESFTIRLAGQYFTICPVCDYIREYCRDYIVADDTEDAMRFRIATTQSDIDFEREKSAREDTKEGIPIRQFSDAYLETLAVYRKQIKVVAQFINATKDQVVKKGLELNIPYKYTWSCYEGGEKPCGKCGTCIDRARAFELNGINDPAME